MDSKLIYRIPVIVLFSIYSVAHAFCQEPDERETEYLLHSIYFGGGSHHVDEQQQKNLFHFIKGIENIEHYEISVHAYTDNIGSKAYNDWLSHQRSEAVIGLLEQYNIHRQTVSIKSFGKINAVYDNRSSEGRLQNRRVDIILWPITL